MDKMMYFGPPPILIQRRNKRSLLIIREFIRELMYEDSQSIVMKAYDYALDPRWYGTIKNIPTYWGRLFLDLSNGIKFNTPKTVINRNQWYLFRIPVSEDYTVSVLCKFGIKDDPGEIMIFKNSYEIIYLRSDDMMIQLQSIVDDPNTMMMGAVENDLRYRPPSGRPAQDHRLQRPWSSFPYPDQPDAYMDPRVMWREEGYDRVPLGGFKQPRIGPEF